MALVLAEGIAGKAPKLKSKVEKMKIDGWDWLGKLIKNKTDEGTVSIKPLDKYLRDLIGVGGFSTDAQGDSASVRRSQCRLLLQPSPAALYIL
jgi:hypothetical protein